MSDSHADEQRRPPIDPTKSIRERLAREKAIVQAATTGPWRWTGDPDQAFLESEVETATPRLKYTPASAPASVISAWGHDDWGLNIAAADAAFIAAWNPARAWAELEAKESILARHLRKPLNQSPAPLCAWCGMNWPCTDLENLRATLCQ